MLSRSEPQPILLPTVRRRKELAAPTFPVVPRPASCVACACGGVVEATDRFCGHCGRRLAQRPLVLRGY